MRISIALLLLVTAFHCFAQDPDLSRRIFSYEDSSEVLIKNSRRLILESIRSRDYVEADRIKDYAEANVDQKQYALFTVGEDILISYHTNDFSRILGAIQYWDSLKAAPYYTYRIEQDQLFENLVQLSLQDSARVYESIDQIVVSGQQKDVLGIVFRSLLFFDPASKITQDDLNKDVEEYLMQYEISPYHKFLKENIRLILEDKWGYAVFFGAGFGGLNGGLSQYVESQTPFFMGMEIYFRRKVFMGFRLQGGSGKAVQDFAYNGDWPQGLKVNPLYIGATGGYAFVDSKRFRVAGHVEMGGISITPIEDERTPETKNLKLNSVAYGPALTVDYYPIAKDGILGETRVGIRVQGGILLLNYENKDMRFEGNYPYLGISIVLDLFEKSIVKD